jgi:hypothetical protein
MKLAQSYYLFASCKSAKELEGKLNTAIVTEMFDEDSITSQQINVLLSLFDWLSWSDKVHIALSAYTHFMLVKREPHLEKPELDTIRFCVSKMLEVNKLEHGEICASILTGAYDRTEEFQRVLTKLSTLK